MDFLYSYIKTICVFTVLLTLILNIFPEKRYIKYIKLFAGFLLLALVLNPILQLKKDKINISGILNENIDNAVDYHLENDFNVLETKIYERVSDEYKTETESADR